MFVMHKKDMRRLKYILLLLSLVSCMNEKESGLPVLITADVTDINQTSASSGGIIKDDGGTRIIARGVCWGTNDKPVINGNKTSDGTGSGTFSSSIAGLNENTTYHLRAYATNITGTGYGNQITFTTTEIEPWMNSPYFALPATGLSLMVDQEVTIYGDALINVPIRNNLHVDYECDIGTKSGNNLTIKPLIGHAGEHTLKMTFTNNGIELTTETIKFTVYEKAPAGRKKILLIGDSTMPPDVQQEKIASILDNSTLVFLGTAGTRFKNEGYGGASWNGYITGTHGKFCKNGVLNIPAYFTDYSIETPDYVYIRLGINDTYSYCEDETGPITDSDIISIIKKAETLVDAFLEYDPNLKIVLGIPTISENSGAGWETNYEETDDQDLFIEQIHWYWKSFIDTFANGKYDPRVDCSYEAIFLDRDNGYPKINGKHNNGIHPGPAGYEQLATGMASAFNKLMKAD
jgi:lysophospholipase L1-like esterase